MTAMTADASFQNDPELLLTSENFGIVFVNDSVILPENLEKKTCNKKNYDRILHEHMIKFTCQTESPFRHSGLPHSKACRKRHLNNIP